MNFYQATVDNRPYGPIRNEWRSAAQDLVNYGLAIWVDNRTKIKLGSQGEIKKIKFRAPNPKNDIVWPKMKERNMSKKAKGMFLAWVKERSVNQLMTEYNLSDEYSEKILNTVLESVKFEEAIDFLIDLANNHYSSSREADMMLDTIALDAEYILGKIEHGVNK